MLRTFRNAAVAALLVGGFNSVSHAALAYDANTTINNLGNFSRAVPGFMQVITLGTPDVAQSLNNFSLLGIRYNADVTAGSSAMFIQFFSDVDESDASTDALLNANYLGEVGYELPAGTAQSYNFTDVPINLSVPGNKVGVAIFLTDISGANYNLNLGPRLTTGSPSVGSNDGYIYLDQNTDGKFVGAERFREIGSVALAPTNLRMVIDATIPEPASLMIFAPALIALRRSSRDE